VWWRRHGASARDGGADRAEGRWCLGAVVRIRERDRAEVGERVFLESPEKEMREMPPSVPSVLCRQGEKKRGKG
jgi:hypothetical protein